MRWTLLVGALLVGCEAVDSSDIRTSGIWADMTVSATGDGTSIVETWLRVGGPLSNTNVDLVEGDSLSVSVSGLSEPLDRVAFGNLIYYIAEVETDAPGEDFVIALDRAADDSAPSSVMSLPEPFTFEDVSDTVSSDTTLEGRISGLDDAPNRLIVAVDGDCIYQHEESVTLDAEGRFEIDGSDLEATDAEDTASCGLEVKVILASDGTVDPAYEGGSAEGHQVRSLQSSYEP